jgi:hypothetical protein
MYEIGGIYHDQLKQPAKAVAAWDRYRARFPHGLLRAEADLSVIDTLANMDVKFGCRHAHAQRGARLPQALPAQRAPRRGRARRGDIYRGRKECRAALDFYRRRRTPRSPPRTRDAASFGQAACLYELRDDGATGALRAYLGAAPPRPPRARRGPPAGRQRRAVKLKWLARHPRHLRRMARGR